MKLFLALAFLLIGFSFVQAQNEQAPILEKELNYKNWSFKKISGDGEINLREFAQGKKLVLVVYFAPWCHNWRYEAPIVQRLYEKYKDKGFEVVGVGEYDSVEAMKLNIGQKGITFPVVYESDSQQAKQKTTHYAYRKEVGDTRNWGSPFNVFLTPENIKKDGETIAKKLFISSGELIEKEAEAFIREKLGLPKDEKKPEVSAKKESEVCEPATLIVKKPS